MIPVILQIHVDRGQWVDVPVTPETMCRDVIECCREPGDQPCRLIQSIGVHEEPVPLDSRMMDVLYRWGEHWSGVSFNLQYSNNSGIPVKGSPTEWMDKRSWPSRELQEGSELSLAELRQMAARQQHQIEAHQQLLVAKEQRLKFLKQQEVRHQQQQQQQHGIVSSVDADRLRHLKEKVELQELKLRRLRALRGQVEQHRSNNTNLSAELESIRALFNEKEKELSMAVAKVEELTRQLEDVRRGDMSGLRQGNTPSPAALEFQKLRRELLYRSKLNEQQNARIAQQRETLARRQSEISQMDQRIAELQQRLQRKRLLNQQLSSQLHAASRARPRANIAAVEPLKRTAQEIELIQDDVKASEEMPEFTPNKKDPKYQTLPYNTKFSGVGNPDSHKLQNGEFEKHPIQNGGPPPYPDPPNNRIQPPNKPLPPQGLGNFSPRPFGTTYSSSLLTSENGRNRQHAPIKSPVLVTAATINTTTNTSKSVVSTATTGVHRSKPSTSFSSHQTVLPPTVMTSQPGVVHTVPQTPARQHPSPGYKHPHQFRLNENSPKPSVPPKPSTPSKPLLPPRQTYGSTVISTSLQKPDIVDHALSVLKGNNVNHRATDNYRMTVKSQASSINPRASQSSIPQYSMLKSDVISEINESVTSDFNLSSSHISSNKNLESTHTPEANSVHISLNRRIGMPPAFFFPENQTPPSDLNTSDEVDPSKRRPIDRFQLQEPSSVESTISTNDANSKTISNSKETSGIKEHKPSSNYERLNESALNFQKISPTSSSDITDRSSSEQESINDSPTVCSAALRRVKKGNLKTKGTAKSSRRVSFDPLALLLDAALEGELELVKRTAKEVPNPSAANDEGITALHNAICAGHLEIVKFLVEFGCDVNAQDSDGWTPLHCAASCNNLSMVKYLVERGACIFATTLSDHETAAEKCEEEEEGFDGCTEYLYSMQEKLGILNEGIVYALYDYENQNADELSFKDGDQLIVLRKGDELEREWWWSKHNDREGYIPRNLIGLYPRVVPKRDP